MPSSTQSFRNRKRNKENESPKKHSKNIGDLSPVVKANLALNREYNERRKIIEIENGVISSMTETNERTPLKGGDRNRQNKRMNETEMNSYHPDHSNHRKAALALQATQSKPLSSTRDPRRRQLQSRLPFAPFSHGTFHENGNGRQDGTTKDRRGMKRRKRYRSESRRKNIKRMIFDKKEITPAYAYKNAQTGLLEISIHPPNSQ